jgi:hypothetical protein
MNELLEDNTQVNGHIYLMTNTQTNKYYVGQTLSHRKNRGLKEKAIEFIKTINQSATLPNCSGNP